MTSSKTYRLTAGLKTLRVWRRKGGADRMMEIAEETEEVEVELYEEQFGGGKGKMTL